jgi:hypothetical protein
VEVSLSPVSDGDRAIVEQARELVARLPLRLGSGAA